MGMWPALHLARCGCRFLRAYKGSPDGRHGISTGRAFFAGALSLFGSRPKRAKGPAVATARPRLLGRQNLRVKQSSGLGRGVFPADSHGTVTRTTVFEIIASQWGMVGRVNSRWL